MFISSDKIKIILVVLLLGTALSIWGGLYYLRNELEKKELQNQLESLKSQVEDTLNNNNSDKKNLANSVPSSSSSSNKPVEIPLNPGSSAGSLQGLGGSAMSSGAAGAGQAGAPQGNQQSSQSQSQPEATPPPEPIKLDMNTGNWKTYTNKKYGYSFKYPAEFDSRECTNEDPCLIGQAFEKEDGNIGLLATGKNNQQGWPSVTVTHQDNETYKLPKDQKLATWVKTKFPNTTVPKSYNYQINSKNGNSKKALNFFDSAGNKDEIFFVLKDDLVIEIQTMGMDKAGAKEFYNVWLKTFNLK